MLRVRGSHPLVHRLHEDPVVARLLEALAAAASLDARIAALSVLLQEADAGNMLALRRSVEASLFPMQAISAHLQERLRQKEEAFLNSRWPGVFEEFAAAYKCKPAVFWAACPELEYLSGKLTCPPAASATASPRLPPGPSTPSGATPPAASAPSRSSTPRSGGS